MKTITDEKKLPLYLMKEQLDTWEKDGYLHLKNAVDLLLILSMKKTCHDVVWSIVHTLQDEGDPIDPCGCSEEQMLMGLSVENRMRFGRGWRHLIATKAIYDLHLAPGLIAALKDLIGQEIIGTPAFNGRPNVPGDALFTVPWHQDQGYYGPEAIGCTLITAWLPIVSVKRDMGAMQVIRGSHKWDYIPHATGKNKGGFLETEKFNFQEEDVLTFEMEPGDVLLFNSMTMHRSVANVSDQVRWSVDLRFGVPGQYKGNDGNLVWQNTGRKDWVLASQTSPVTNEVEWMELIRHHLKDC